MPKRSRTDSLSSIASLSVANSSSPTDAAPPPAKYTHTVRSSHAVVMECSLPPHELLSFPSYAAYDIHYAQSHTNRCSECRKNFPSEHFLNLHIGENHDPLNEARRARGEKTYVCFLPDCDKVCSTTQKRRMHLIDKHMFPKNYDFLVINTGMDKRSSMLRTRRRHSSAASHTEPQNPSFHQRTDSRTGEGGSTTQEIEAASSEQPPHRNPNVPAPKQTTTNQYEMDSLTESMSALKFIPPSVRFGRGGRRGGLAKS